MTHKSDFVPFFCPDYDFLSRCPLWAFAAFLLPKQEMADIAILQDVFLTFGAQFAG